MEEYADKHFLDDAEVLVGAPWPEAKERYKKTLADFAGEVLSGQWVDARERLPETDRAVSVFFHVVGVRLIARGAIAVGYFDEQENYWSVQVYCYTDKGGRYVRTENCCRVEFWLDIPDAPEIDDEDEN